MEETAMKAWTGPILRRLRWLGWPVLGALGVALLAAGFYLTAVRPASHALEALQGELDDARTQHRLLAQRSVRQSPRLQLASFYQTFPAATTAPNLLERIYVVARANNLELLRGDYRIIRSGPSRLARYQLTLPLTGSYPDIRGFLDEVLSAVPTASLDKVAFERQKIGETTVQVTVRLTLYLRGAA
jgi:Tfp pilus assembly protein PilO